MKNYPYIFSLSTVGLIHHYNCDYIFNRVRTDFTGDSGSGKSLIADLLQLVFVGSSVFVAATESLTEKRAPSGMVLNDKKRGYGGKGYVFLNIAISSNEYLVMGMYLEGSTNHSRPFVVINGFDLENPVFLDKPLLFKEFLDQESILPIEDLRLHLKNKEYNCEALQMPGYHKFLFKQNILPFDLADNPEKLKTYALIIRSFSRGKGFKFDTQSLQDFLFGIEKEKEILTHYTTGLENIKNSADDSLHYQKQINLLKEKKGKLKILIDLEKKRIGCHKKYLDNRYTYWQYQYFHSNKDLLSIFKDISIKIIETTILQQLDLENQIKELEKQITDIKKAQEGISLNNRLKEQERIAKEKYLISDSAFKQIKTIDNLLQKFNGSMEELKNYYTLQVKNIKDRASLNEFKTKLIGKKILQEFSTSEWSKNYKEAIKNYNLKIIELNKEIDDSNALLKFSNIEDSQSTAFWAINRKKDFSKEEESLLIKLPELIVSNPVDKNKRYLPDPETLFNSINVKNADTNGFWMSFNGIYEYVPYVTTQFLNNNDPSTKRSFFKNKHTIASTTLLKAEKEKQQQETFYQSLTSISNLEQCIQLFLLANEINKFEIIESLNMSEEKFDESLHNHAQKVKVEAEYDLDNIAWTNARDELKANSTTLERIKGITDIPKFIKDQQIKLDLQKTKQTDLITNINRLTRLLKYNSSEIISLKNAIALEIEDSTITEVTRTKVSSENLLREQRKKSKQTYLSAKKEIRNLIQEYEAVNWEQPIEDITTIPQISLDESLKSNYADAKQSYAVSFEVFLDSYLPHDKYKYEGEDDWRKLARATLPEVFKNSEITEEEFTFEIDDHLDAIIKQNSIIGDRKIQILMNVFDQIEATFSRFSNEVDKLKAFFNGNDKRITGGHKVVLKFDPSNEYPIKWINEFKKKIRQADIDRTGLFKIIDDNIDFKDIIQKVFKECGGKKHDPKIKDLLNPKKYFELTFKLEKDNVSNSGSTGQVYSAIALLCIARISLMEKDENTSGNKAIRFMPIDEAEGLGSNYEMLSSIAKSEDYQVVSMSINPVGEFEEGSHYIYMLNEPEDEEVKINGEPFAQFSEETLTENLKEYIYEHYNG